MNYLLSTIANITCSDEEPGCWTSPTIDTLLEPQVASIERHEVSKTSRGIISHCCTIKIEFPKKRPPDSEQYLKHPIQALISYITKSIEGYRCWTLQLTAWSQSKNLKFFIKKDIIKEAGANLPDENGVERYLPNTRTSKIHFSKIIHKIACWKNINSRKVVLSQLLKKTNQKTVCKKIGIVICNWLE